MAIEAMNIKTIIFSKDRAMQLDAVLRSFFLHCQDAEECTVIQVIYKVSNELHARQYNELSRMFPQVHFVKQWNFRQDLIDGMVPDQQGWLKTFLYRMLLGISSIGFSVSSRADAFMRRYLDPLKIRILKRLLVKNKLDDGILFLVDDNIFVHDFFLADMINALLKSPEAIGFSLRLGRNTQYCYTLRQEQLLPEFKLRSQKIIKYNWTMAELDFAYPLEISSSLYLTDVVAPIIISASFRNPNELEGKMAARSFIFQNQYPELLCFDESVTFCNPINVVQSVYKNRAAEQVNLSADHLAKLFAEDKRINIHSFDGFTPNACHQEVKLTFEDKLQ